MNPAFLPPATGFLTQRKSFPTCKRPPQRRVHHAPTSLAKYQQDTNETPESETPLENIIPPPALPTLTTLTGDQTKQEDEALQQTEIDLSQISTMGAGISPEHEKGALVFLKGVFNEFGLVEWPSAERVIRLTVIILLTIVIAIVGLYFVDGFLYRMANIFFEGKI